MPDAPETDDFAALAPLVLDHLNQEHADALLVVARAFAGVDAPTAATAVGVHATGLVLRVEHGGEPIEARVEFSEPVADVAGVRTQTVELVRRARERLGDVEPTEIEVVTDELARVRTFIGEVVRTAAIGPRYREITVGGGDLARFEPISPDQFLFLLGPPLGRTELTVGRDFTWEAAREMAPEDAPIGAYYSVRRWRPEVLEMDLVVVDHEGGEAADWLGAVAPGDPIALWGPRSAFRPPSSTERYLLVADETGLWAAAAIVESLPAGTPVTVVAEVGGPADRIDVPGGDAVRTIWIDRGDAAPGTTEQLLDAVRELPLAADGLYAWGGAESHVMTAIRRHLRDEVGLERAAVSMTGYWRLPAR